MSLPGNPAQVEAGSTTLREQARKILEAAEKLRSLNLESTSDAVSAVREKSASTASSLDVAHERYNGTGTALKTYAVEMREAHRKANAAEENAAIYRRQESNATDGLSQAERTLRVLETSDASNYRIRDAEYAVADARLAQQNAADNYQSAMNDIESARKEMNEAAERAQAAIKGILSESNEGILDHIGNFFEDLGEFFAAIDQWVRDFLAEVWETLKAVVMTVMQLLFVALLFVMIYAIAAAIAPILGTIVAVVLAIVATIVVLRILDDATKPTPKVEEWGRDERGKQQVQSDEESPSRSSEALLETKEVDTSSPLDENGVPSDTVIKVTKVVDEDGTVRWRVALPSTQDWITMLGNDAGAVNDLDSNLLLLLTPALQSQYERAVLQALKDAGVGKNDPVMLVGFSQGGILAGKLAAYNNDYNWDAIMVAGAPIDSMPIPSDVTVVSVQHPGDPVPRLDELVGAGREGRQADNWMTITDPATDHVDGGTGHDWRAENIEYTELKDLHSAENYAHTLDARMETVNARFPELNQYFVNESGSFGESSSYYGWSE